MTAMPFKWSATIPSRHKLISSTTFAVHGPWPNMHHIRNDQGVPNLSSHRQDPQLVALGTTIRRIRQSNEVSQEKLALMAELDRSYMGRIERGDNNVAMLTLSRIAAALGITMSQLLAEAGL